MKPQYEEPSPISDGITGALAIESRRRLFERGGIDLTQSPPEPNGHAILQWWHGSTQPADLDIAAAALRPQCLAYLVRKGCPQNQAEDMYSESCLRVLDALQKGTIIPRHCYRSFFYRTLLTTWLMSVRRGSREHLEASPESGPPDSPPSEWLEEAVLTIPDCVSALPSPLLDLVHHRYYGQQSFSSFAAQSRMSAVEVCRLHTRALTRLFECLKRKGVELPLTPARQGMRQSTPGRGQ